MTEPTEPDAALDAALDAPLDPEREAAVRRTLAAAGGPEPMPEAVAVRLDGVIDDLVDERAAERAATVSHPENPGIVVPLDAAARRRRVRVRVLLGAAAAVVAVAVGAGIVTDTGRDSDGDASTATADEVPARDEAGALGTAKDAPSDGAAAANPDRSGLDDTVSAAPEAASPLPRRVVTDEPLREVSADHLRENLVALQHVSLPHPAAADYSAATLTAPADFMCEAADFGAGYLVGVEYDGKPAVVAFREPVGSTQVAEVLACGTGDVLHSTILAAS